MVAVTSPATLLGTAKSVNLTSHVRHPHKPSPILKAFVPPAPAVNISFGPLALAAAVARTATTQHAPYAVLKAMQRSVLAQLQYMITVNSTFELSPHFSNLADIERTLFSARVGAGVTDLLMNSLGYVWRANADTIAGPNKPHPDYIYDSGHAAGLGVVLAEAHGTFAMSTTEKSVKAVAEKKYKRQVKPYLAQLTVHGYTLHGYSVAFGSKPGSAGSFLALSETKVNKVKRRPPKVEKDPSTLEPSIPSAGRPRRSIQLTAHRSNFLLMDLPQIVAWIDWLSQERELPAVGEVYLVRCAHAGRHFLANLWSLMPCLRFVDTSHDDIVVDHITLDQMGSADRQPLRWFAMEEEACIAFLSQLRDRIQSAQELRLRRFDLPETTIAGFADSTDKMDFEKDVAVFRDGLALLLGPRLPQELDVVVWHPARGVEIRSKGWKFI